MHKEVLEQSPVEVCVLGEGEVTLIELLDAMQSGGDFSKIAGIAFRGKDGQIVKTAKRARIADPDVLPLPAWDLLDPMAYLAGEVFMGPAAGRSMPMLATRGCPFRCTFCSSPNMWTQVWKARKPQLVVDEMQRWMRDYGANDFQFQDLTAIVRKDWIVAFCKELVARKLNITWSLPVGTRSEAIDAEVSKLLVASGCHHVTYAPESGSEDILRAIEKKVHLGHLEESALGSIKAGMKVCLFMIVGFPQESDDDIKKTFRWLRRMARLGVHEIAVSTFVPLPGTQLFGETAQIKPIVVDDEYCYWMTGATSLFTIKSWNPRISDARLRFLKLSAMAQFYLISYLFHPGRLVSLFTNMLRGKQETKVDRVIQEFASKLKAVAVPSR
jgi:anaerobic magnesium-protoporphyrin IX monomethyl ester cyclase